MGGKICGKLEKIYVVVDIDPPIMIMVCGSKDKKRNRQKDKNTKTKNGLCDSRTRGPAAPTVLVMV